MDTTSHLPGKIQGTKHAKQSVWSDQKPDQQSDPSVTRPVGDVASTTDAAHVGPKQTIVASKAGNNESPFGIGQALRPMFVYPQTDLGFAQMYHRRFGHHVRFDHERGQWLAWDVRNKRWTTGRLATNIMMRFVKKVVTELYSLAQSRRPLRTRNGETVTPEEVLVWAKSASQKSRQKAMLELVRDFAGVRVSKDELDSDPFLLGVANGVVDHRTGTLIENRPELLITRYANAAYHPDAKAPIFLRVMDEICLGRQGLVDFLQEVFGCSLSGLIKEHAFFLMVGTGANGKSTLVETFMYLLGDYAVGMPSHAFLKSNSRAIRNDIARLPGVRFAACGLA